MTLYLQHTNLKSLNLFTNMFFCRMCIMSDSLSSLCIDEIVLFLQTISWTRVFDSMLELTCIEHQSHWNKWLQPSKKSSLHFCGQEKFTHCCWSPGLVTGGFLSITDTTLSLESSLFPLVELGCTTSPPTYLCPWQKWLSLRSTPTLCWSAQLMDIPVETITHRLHVMD